MRMQARLATLAVAAAAAAGAATAYGASGSQPAAGQQGTVASAQPVHTKAMERLMQSAQRLRESIQALAQKPPGQQRDTAIAKAHEALLETQQAMLALPPELRSTGTVSAAGYDEAVRQLMKSADSLRESIQAMAQQPAGERRNQAIEQANRALWDTQVAMAHAYQPKQQAQTMGSSPSAGSGKQQAQSASTSAGAQPVATLVLIPVQMAGDKNMANGCWVRFFDDKNFRGDALTLVGPVDMARMEIPGNLWKDWDSAIVGPRATVRTFDNENFRERTAVLNANQSIADLRDRKLGWFEEIKSARVSCG